MAADLCLLGAAARQFPARTILCFSVASFHACGVRARAKSRHVVRHPGRTYLRAKALWRALSDLVRGATRGITQMARRRRNGCLGHSLHSDFPGSIRVARCRIFRHSDPAACHSGRDPESIPSRQRHALHSLARNIHGGAGIESAAIDSLSGDILFPAATGDANRAGHSFALFGIAGLVPDCPAACVAEHGIVHIRTPGTSRRASASVLAPEALALVADSIHRNRTTDAARMDLGISETLASARPLCRGSV